MICCRCLAAREGTGFEPHAAITVYRGDALCREHWIVAWEHDLKPVHAIDTGVKWPAT